MPDGTISDLLKAVVPKCRVCSGPATRKGSVRSVPFCDTHATEDLSSTDPQSMGLHPANVTYTDLPHAIPIRQLQGNVAEDKRRWCLRVSPPEESQHLGEHLVLVHEKFVVVRTTSETSDHEMANLMEAIQKATGNTEVLVVSDTIELDVMSVVEPRSRYERLMEEDGNGD